MSIPKKKVGTYSLGQKIDMYCVMREILRKWWVILLIGISAALLSFVNEHRSYHPTYTIETVYAVKAKGVNTSVLDNLNTAKDTATRFSQIINSSILQKKVAEDLGTGGVPGIISTEIIPETNLMKLKVTANSPQMAYKVLQSIIQNYPTIAQYLVGNAVLEVLIAPVIPVEPNSVLDVEEPMRKAFVLGAAAVVALIVILSYFKDTVHNSNEVKQKLDAHLLGVIHHEDKYKTLLSKLNRKNTALLVTNPTTSFRYVEVMKKISLKIKNRLDQNQAKILMVTSCVENEGKSTVSANIALNLAYYGNKVVVVDLDLRKPAMYKVFDIKPEDCVQLGDVLLGKSSVKDLIHTLEDKKLYAVLNIKEYQKSAAMLGTRKMENIIKQLKNNFDYVIIDTPPMTYVADTEEIADIADASLIVVREDTASAKEINDMIDVLQNCKASFIGCIFNDAHTAVGERIFSSYGYGYGYGYSYGYGKYYGKYDSKDQ